MSPHSHFYRPYLLHLEDRLPPGDALAWLLWGSGLAAPAPTPHVVVTPSADVVYAPTEERLTQGPTIRPHVAAIADVPDGHRVLTSWLEEQPEANFGDPLHALAWFGTPTPRKRTPTLPDLARTAAAAAPGTVALPVGSPAAMTAATMILPSASRGTTLLDLATRATASPAAVTPTSETQARESLGRLPLYFEANHGQTDAQVHFLARGPGYSLFLTGTEAVMLLNTGGQVSEPVVEEGQVQKPAPQPETPPAVVRMQFVGANATPQVTGRDPLPGKVNYFLGNDPTKWQTNVPTFGRVAYDEVYPGIDLVYYGSGKQLEYDFVVAPGADSRQITLNFAGAERLEVDGQGDLVVHAGGVQLRQHRPVTYQMVDGVRREVASAFVADGARVRFQVAAYDAGRELVIDPVVSYSTYLGGSGDNRGEEGRGIAVDAAGNTYVTGVTDSRTFPLADPYQPDLRGTINAFVTALNADGSSFIYSTYFGGGGSEDGRAVAVDADGNAYVTGVTRSTDFPTMDPLQPQLRGNSDAFVTKFNAAGSRLIYSTYLGGSGGDAFGQDWGAGIAVDAFGHVYVTGTAGSLTFPTVNPIQGTLRGVYDAFISKVASDGSELLYSTYLGGVGFLPDDGAAIAVDAEGNAVVTGRTGAVNFPTVRAVQPFYGGGNDDAFVAKLNSAGSELLFSTFLGGFSTDEASGVALGPNGAVYVTGRTFSPNFPTVNALQSEYGGDGDVFVTRLSPDGTAFEYSTFLGGEGNDEGSAFAVDAAGNAIVVGKTGSVDFPAVEALQPPLGLGAGFRSADGGESWAVARRGLLHGTFTLAIDPSDSAVLYAGTWRGVFKSTDGGATWQFSSMGMDPRELRVQAVVIDPSEPRTLYAGTDSDFFMDRTRVYKSTDAGASWRLTSLSNQRSRTVSALAIDPLAPSTVYAGTDSGIYKTTDGGDTWLPINEGLTERSVLSLAIDPLDPLVLYAGTVQRGVFKTTDGGQSWSPSSDGLGNVIVPALAIDPVEPATLYAATGFNDGNAGLFKSIDAGQSWVPASKGLTGLPVMSLAVNPHDTATIYAVTARGGFFKSADGGASWSARNEGLWNLQLGAVAADPRKSSVIHVGARFGTTNAFITKIAADGSRLLYSTHFGGHGLDAATAVAAGPDGAVHVTGRTESTDFPAINAIQPTFGGGRQDAFVVKISDARGPLLDDPFNDLANWNDLQHRRLLGRSAAAAS